MASSVRFDAS